MSWVNSFSPIIDNNCRVLILGSMPGEESLRKQQYYANPRNQFWEIIYFLFDCPVEDAYEKRIEFLKNRGIGLWDVIETCYREGSLDSDIKEEKANDFAYLYQKYPSIKYVCFNGSKAYETYRKKMGFNTNHVFVKLESTSPANTKRFEEKLKNWSIIKTFINS